MKAESGLSYPEASLSTPYGKVLAFVLDRTRVYVMTGWRKPRLRVGDDSVYVDFYLVRGRKRGDRGWRLDTYASSLDGRRGPVAAGVREKITRAVASEVETWVASVPQSAIVSAERLGFQHNKRTTLRSEIPDLIFAFRNNAEILDLSADNRCLAGADPAVYERMRELARKMRALIEPVKEFGREVRATRFRPLEGGCEHAA
ncbi:hypothetical protein [Candidatus Binatus sp.]|uniref:hypothetical protein n=1 Tax=Candidatus Binatus sp. TaxID=2811406 RepID=UPI003CC66DC9